MSPIKDTRYFRYIKNRQNAELIEDENGFVIYKIRGNECFLIDIEIDAEKREQGCARKMIEKLESAAKANGCNFISADIFLQDPNASLTIIAALKVGFKILNGSQSAVLIVKEIRS